MSEAQLPSKSPSPGGVDLAWVWREVRKRVFIKMQFSLGVADALEAAVPVIMDGDCFVIGLAPKDFPMAQHLNSEVVHNTIENILRQAAGKSIKLEVIEGTEIEDWDHVVERRNKAQEAVLAMAGQAMQEHHLEDMLNQIVGEIRHRVSQIHDRTLPQIKASLVLDIAASLADAEEMLLPETESRESRRAMGRAIDRIAGFIEVQPVVLAIEVERNRRVQKGSPKVVGLFDGDSANQNGA